MAHPNPILLALATLILSSSSLQAAEPISEPESASTCEPPQGDEWTRLEWLRDTASATGDCEPDTATLLDNCAEVLGAGACIAIANRVLDLPSNQTVGSDGALRELGPRTLDPEPTATPVPLPTVTRVI